MSRYVDITVNLLQVVREILMRWPVIFSYAFRYDFLPWQYYVNIISINPLSANPTKWSNTLKHFVGDSRQIV